MKITAFLMFVVFYSSLTYCQSQIPNQSVPADHATTTQNPPKPSNAINQIPSSSQTENNNGNAGKYELWNVVLLGVMTFLYAVLAGIGMWQVWHSDKTAKRQLRAYMCVEMGLPIEQTDVLKYEFHAVTTNVGQTPAHDVIQSGAVKFMNPNDLIHNHPLTWSEESSHAMTGAGKPKDFSVWADRRFTEAEIQEMQTGDRRLCVYGTIKYKDVFGKAWFTNYSYYVIWGDKKKPICLHCTHHNDAT